MSLPASSHTSCSVLNHPTDQMLHNYRLCRNDLHSKADFNAFSCFWSQAGLIRTDKGEFFIEPLEKGQQDVESKGRVHVVYRRSAIKAGQQKSDFHNEGGQVTSAGTKKVLVL